MSTSVKLNQGERLETRLSYRTPDKFVCVQGIWPVDRKWWQFWLPKMLSIYTVTVPGVVSAVGEEKKEV